VPPVLGGPPRIALLVLLVTAALVGTTGAAARSDALATLHISPSGSDSAGCTAARPCESFARAYRVAKPGQIVVVAGGEYDGQQEIPVDGSKRSAADVIFRPAPGAKVVVESLDVYGHHSEVRGIRVERDLYVKCDATDFTFRGGQMGVFFIRSGHQIRLIGTEIGPWIADSDSDIGTAEECREANSNILLDRVYFHDHISTNPPNGAHKQCLAVTAIDGLTIRNSRFHRCEDFGILFKRYGPVAELKNITLENNFFGDPHPDGTSAIQFSSPGGGSYTNVLIRNNSFGATLTMKPDIRYVNTQVIGNAGTKFGGPCGNVQTAFNVWADGACRGDLRASPGFRDPDKGDFRLKPGAAAINRGHPKSFPARDIDGQKRPRGGRADAGADEFVRN
jgi:hypothetical protein